MSVDLLEFSGACQKLAALEGTGIEGVGALNVAAGNARPDYLKLAGVLNQLAGTTGLEATAAANTLAGTTGLELVGALNLVQLGPEWPGGPATANLAFTDDGYATGDLAWSTAAGATSYDYEIIGTAISGNTASLTVAATGLNPGSNYSMRVRAVGIADGPSRWVTIRDGCPAIPAPTTLAASDVQATQIELTFTEPAAPPYTIDDYQVNEFAIPLGDEVAAGSPFTYPGLTAETQYSFRVRSRAGTNYSTWSNVVIETTPES